MSNKSSHPPSGPRGKVLRTMSDRSPTASSSKQPLPSPLYIEASGSSQALAQAVASSSSSASSSYQSQGTTAASNLATRTRSRSVGSKSREVDDPRLFNGAETPDFVLGKKRSSNRLQLDLKGKGRVSELANAEEDGATPSAAGPSSSSSSSTGHGNRPRLTTRLRSYFTSFHGSEDTPASAAMAEAKGSQYKARHSGELERCPKSPHRHPHRAGALRPAGLVIPSARPADAFESNLVLNTDSPPLTPISDEGQSRSSTTASRHHHYSQSEGPAYWLPAAQGSSASSAESMGSSNFTPATSRTHSPWPDTTDCRPVMSLGTGAALTQAPLLPEHYHSPLSTPTTSRPKTTFSTDALYASLNELLQSRALRQNMPTLLMLLTFFVASTLVVFLLLTTLPLKMPAHSLTQLSLAEIRDICLSLREYANSTPTAYHHTLFVLCLFYTYKQAFNVPGSIISNVVFGALFGVWRATFWLSIFTAIGGSGASIMSALVAPLILRLPGMHKGVAMMRKALGSQNLGKSSAALAVQRRLSNSATATGTAGRHRKRPSPNSSRSGTPRLPQQGRARTASPHPSAKNKGHRSPHAAKSGGNLFSILLLLRLLPLTPYGMMNIACGILNVPLIPFATTMAIGSVPWNAVTAQLGEILVEVVAAFPLDGGAVSSSPTLADQMDSGGFHDAPQPADGNLTSILSSANGLDPKGAVAAASSLLASASTDPSRLSSAAHKAGGGIKILLSKIWTKEMIFKLIGLSLLSVTPILVGKWWKTRQAAKQRSLHGGSDGKVRRSASTRMTSTPMAMRELRGSDQSGSTSGGESHWDQGEEQQSLQAPMASQQGNNSHLAAVLAWSDGEDGSEDEDDGQSSFSYDEEEDYNFDSSEEDLDTKVNPLDDSNGDVALPRPSTPSSASSFAATVAEYTSPAMLASLTRSASRSGWNSSTSWFGSGNGSTSPAKTFSGLQAHQHLSPTKVQKTRPTSWNPTSADLAGWSRFGAGGVPLTTPQLELAQDPFHPQTMVAATSASSEESGRMGGGGREPRRLHAVVRG